MILDSMNVRIFLEGIDVSARMSSFVLYTSEKKPPSMQVTFAGSKGVLSLLPTTLLHVFVKSKLKQLSNEWFLLFEGELSARSVQVTHQSDNVSLQFKSTSGIYNKTYHARIDYSNLVAGISSDMLYGNVGLGGGLNNVNVVTTSSPLSNNFLALNEWKKWRDVAKNNPEELSKGGGTGKFYREMLDSIDRNNPSIKIASDSLKTKERVKVFSNDKMFTASVNMDFMTQIHTQMTQDNVTETYENMMRRMDNIFMLKKVNLGIPSKIDGEITDSIVIPNNEFCVPSTYNILYEDEFSDYSISINYDNEPTRLMSSSFGAAFKNALGMTPKEILPKFLSPTSELLIEGGDQEGKASFLKFTEEEKYRGINPSTMTTQPLLHSAYIWMAKGEKIEGSYGPLTKVDTEKIKKSADKKTEEYWEIMSHLADYTFYTRKLNARGTGALTLKYFNTSWLMGFPGVFFTKTHGPMIVNFSGATFSYNAANNSVSTSLSISQPRMVDDLMDIETPNWYESYLENANIGKEFYSRFSSEKLDTSIRDVTEKESNEEAVLYMGKNKKISNKYRKRDMVSRRDIFKKLKIKTLDGFPSVGVTEYRKSSELSALKIAVDAKSGGTLDYLECAYVMERGEKVAEWMGIEKELKLFPESPPDYVEEELLTQLQVDRNYGKVDPGKSFMLKVAKYYTFIEGAGKMWNVHPDLLRAVMRQESNGIERPENKKQPDALGLMQIRPDAAKDMGGIDPENPEEAIYGAAYYIGKIIPKYLGTTNLSLILAAYNGGMGNVKKYNMKIPPFPETQKYVPAVIGFFNYMKGE